MSVIKTTNSTCTVHKIEYRGTQAIVYLKITAFARTVPEKGVLVFFRDTGSTEYNPAFKVSSEDDVPQSKIFWINTSNLTGHTHQTVGMDAIIPVPIDMSKGVYRNKHLYREINVLLVDYQDEQNILWISEVLHLCSEPIHINVKGSLYPRFRLNNTGLYSMSLDYEFSENSWLFNLDNSEVTLDMRVMVHQSTPFEIKEVILPNKSSGSWLNISDTIERDAHVIIKAELRINNNVIWTDSIQKVPGEISSLHIKTGNNIHTVTHKAVQTNSLTRDAHIYHTHSEQLELNLLIAPWRDYAGNHITGTGDIPLYTIEAYIKKSNGSFSPLKNYFTFPIKISKVYFNENSPLNIPSNLTGNISDDFATIIYNNYDPAIAEMILSNMLYLGQQLHIVFSTIKNIKIPKLIITSSSDILIGDGDGYGLTIQ